MCNLLLTILRYCSWNDDSKILQTLQNFAIILKILYRLHLWSFSIFSWLLLEIVDADILLVFLQTSHHLCGFKKASSFRAIVGWTPSWLEILNVSNVSSFGLVVAIAMPAAWATKYLWRKRTSFCERKSSPIIKFHIHNNQQTKPLSLTNTLQGSIHKSELLSGRSLLRNRFAIVASIVTTKADIATDLEISRACTPSVHLLLSRFSSRFFYEYRPVIPKNLPK